MLAITHVRVRDCSHPRIVKDAAIKEAAIKDAVIKDSVIKEAVIKEAAIKDAAIKDAAIKDAVQSEKSVAQGPFILSQFEGNPFAQSTTLLENSILGRNPWRPQFWNCSSLSLFSKLSYKLFLKCCYSWY